MMSPGIAEPGPHLFTDLRLRLRCSAGTPSHLQFHLINSRPLISSSGVSRRHLLTNGGSRLLLLLTSQLFPAQADEIASTTSDTGQQQEISSAQTPATTSSCVTDKISGKKVFLDVSINGDPAGRIVIGLFQKDAPTGAARFASLVSGTAGVSYRRKEFVKIMPNYVQHGGLRSSSVDAEMVKRTGSALAQRDCWRNGSKQLDCVPRMKNLARTVASL